MRDDVLRILIQDLEYYKTLRKDFEPVEILLENYVESYEYGLLFIDKNRNKREVKIDANKIMEISKDFNLMHDLKEYVLWRYMFADYDELKEGYDELLKEYKKSEKTNKDLETKLAQRDNQIIQLEGKVEVLKDLIKDMSEGESKEGKK